MLKKIMFGFLALALVGVIGFQFVPTVVSAVPPTIAPGSDPDFSKLNAFIGGAGNIINVLVALCITLALLFFIWGLATYLLSSGDPEKNAEGKNRMIQGVIALFVIVSIWGIIAWLGNLFGIGQGGTDTPMPVPTTDYNDLLNP